MGFDKGHAMKVIELVVAKLDKYSKSLSDVGLRYRINGPAERISGFPEIEIDFIADNGNIEDVLEFPLYHHRDRDRTISLPEIDEWLDDNINNVIRSAKKDGPS